MGCPERCPPAHEGLFKMDWLHFENALTIICLLYTSHLLSDGAASLGDLPVVLNQSQSGSEGGDPIYAGVGLKPPVLLGDIGILNVHADVADVHILIMASVDQADLVSVLVVNNGIRQHAEV